MISYEKIIVFSWVAFIVVWVIFAFNVKRDIRGGFSSIWRQYWLLRIVGAAAILYLLTRNNAGTAHLTNMQNSVFAHGIFSPPLFLGWIGAILSVLGVAFAIWARVHLGRNWSAQPAVKEQHELVTSGPYAFVRHPIYTGMIFAALGTFLTGSFFGAGVLVFACAVFLWRIGKEEKIMLELFPNQYPAYQTRTKRLIPFIW